MVEHVPRECNRAADAICTAALDGYYVPDAQTEELIAMSEAARVEVAFMAELRKQVAREAEARLLAASDPRVTLTPARIKG